MGMSSTLNPCGNGAQIVDKLLGEAYETVRHVATHIEYVKHVSLHMEQVYRVHGSIAAVDALNDNLFKLDALYTELINLLAVYDSLDDLVAISSKLSQLLVIFSSLTELLAVYNNLPKIQDVFDNLTILQEVHAKLTELQAIYTNLSAILTVHSNLTSINTVSSNIAAVNAINTNLTALLDVHSKLTELLYVEANMDTFLEELDTLTAMDGRISGLETLTETHTQTITNLESGKQTASANLTELATVNPGTAGKTILALETPAAVLSEIGGFAADNVIDDDTFATASATNVPSSESVKAYADTKANLNALLLATLTYNWPSIPIGGMLAHTFSVPGAELGDVIIGQSLEYSVPNGVIFQGSVTSANIVTLVLVNHSDAPFDLPANVPHRIVLLKNNQWGLQPLATP